MKRSICLLIALMLLVILLVSCMTLSANETSVNTTEEPAGEEPSEAENTAELPVPTMQLKPTATPVVSMTQPAVQPTPAPTEQVETVHIDLNTVYAEVVSSLPEGAALFNPAASMRLGKVYPVEVRVAPVSSKEIEDDEDVIATLTVGMEDNRPVVVIPLKVSTVMSARLTGESFTIKALSAEEQIRTPDQPYTSWVWEVRPEQTGEQRLTLHLSVIVNAEGMGDKTYTTNEVREVEVEMNPLYLVSRFMGSNWEWVATGVVLPFLGWGYRKISGRRRGIQGV
ncbi:MAG: hypothetical protein JW757_01895 [Anaerolineales bacterium]|nr:hypothetical protein [Anaerolineales bacterium]